MEHTKLDPGTRINGLDGVSVADFWSWAYSDIRSNTIRPILAEFVVGHALGVVASPRIEWDAIDLTYKGKTIEVKSAACQQSWTQCKPSVISFDIAKKKAWHAATNTYEPEARRSSDYYVFCLDPAYDKAHTYSLDISSWEFFILPTRKIDEEFKNQKSVRLSRIRNLSEPIYYDELKEQIDQALN